MLGEDAGDLRRKDDVAGRLLRLQPHALALALALSMAGEIDPLGNRKDALDEFLGERVAEGFTVETRTDTHAIIFQRPKGLRRFTGGDDPGRYVVEVDEDAVASMRPAEPRRS